MPEAINLKIEDTCIGKQRHLRNKTIIGLLFHLFLFFFTCVLYIFINHDFYKCTIKKYVLTCDAD